MAEMNSELEPASETPHWLRATLDDLAEIDIESPISGILGADSAELSTAYAKAARAPDGDGPAETSFGRVYAMLAAVTGMYFQPARRNEPFGPMLQLREGGRTPIPEDFRGAPLDVLAAIAEGASNPVLRARVNDVCWLLDRRRGQLGRNALSAYLEIIRETERGGRNSPPESDASSLSMDTAHYLRRALQIGRSIGWDRPETVAARDLTARLRQRAAEQRSVGSTMLLANLDLDYGVSDPVEIGAAVEHVLRSLPGGPSPLTTVELWRLAARAYTRGKRPDDANRCQSEAAEALVAFADGQGGYSAMMASHHLSLAIAELHGVPGKRERRRELQHRLVDVQAGIVDEMNTHSEEFDFSEELEAIRDRMSTPLLIDKLFAFATLTRSPNPEAVAAKAAELIEQFPLSSIFGTSHHDHEGKVLYRTEGGLGNGTVSESALQEHVAKTESIRRSIAAAAIDEARHAINEAHYISEDVLSPLLQHSPFIPPDLILTFSRGFTRFIRGDFVSALYILTPLLENSLRHVLKLYGHDVTIFDDATQTQQDRTISGLFEQMRPELEAAFPKAIIADIDNVFLKKPGPHLRHQLAHGLLHDGDPYGPDAQYACWLLMRISLLPLLPHKEIVAPLLPDT